MYLSSDWQGRLCSSRRSFVSECLQMNIWCIFPLASNIRSRFIGPANSHERSKAIFLAHYGEICRKSSAHNLGMWMRPCTFVFENDKCKHVVALSPNPRVVSGLHAWQVCNSNTNCCYLANFFCIDYYAMDTNVLLHNVNSSTPWEP